MKLLVALDFDATYEPVIEQAKVLARAFSSPLWLLHVASPDPDFVGYGVGPPSERDAVARRFHQEHCRLQESAQALRATGLDCTAVLVQGPTIEKILSEAEKLPADLIIIGSEGKGPVERVFAGSTSEGVLHGASVPVLVVPGPDSTD